MLTECYCLVQLWNPNWDDITGDSLWFRVELGNAVLYTRGIFFLKTTYNIVKSICWEYFLMKHDLYFCWKLLASAGPEIDSKEQWFSGVFDLEARKKLELMISIFVIRTCRYDSVRLLGSGISISGCCFWLISYTHLSALLMDVLVR